MARHYLDHASTSPARPVAVEAVVAALTGELAADPARVHTEGRMARAALEQARAALAALLGVTPRQVVFTSGATEAINSAVWGACRARPGAVLCAGVEHSAVRESSARSAPVVEVEVDRTGRIHPEAVEEAGRRAVADHGAVALVHCQWANHEVGTLQPVAEVAEVAHRLGALCHVDAAAAVGHAVVDLAGVGADLASVSGHKFGAPKGSGALVVRRGLRVEPLIVGGEQERARRAGMEDTAAQIGLGAAARALSGPALAEEMAAARRRTGRLLAAALSVPDVVVYGDPDSRLDHIVCLGVAGVEAEAVVIGLDQAGVAVHSGSACSSESFEPSPVLAAMGVDADRSVRVSVGWSSTEEDVDAFASAFAAVVDRLRSLR
ncbi:MAG TPA: aminotransferase class V-fold PLP-dependent enzyme [Acidimicrobiales bacterium]|nr:aminotransferase class V-fold PLP-dependent enzyme [Acidimicrobiales bacterium]